MMGIVTLCKIITKCENCQVKFSSYKLVCNWAGKDVLKMAGKMSVLHRKKDKREAFYRDYFGIFENLFKRK